MAYKRLNRACDTINDHVSLCLISAKVFEKKNQDMRFYSELVCRPLN